MKRVFFLVNSPADYDFGPLLSELLPGVDCSSGTALPAELSEYHLVVLWSIRKLLPGVAGRDNVIVFHSSDLPRGKGWAPIYNAIARDQERFTISGLLPVEEADAGDVVVKARFRIRPEHTAEHLRAWDHRICILLIGKLLERFPDGHLRGARQSGEESWYPRRKPHENAVDPSRTLESMMNHLRACEPGHPAYLDFRGVRYRIQVSPMEAPAFPDDLEIEFHDSP